MQVAQLLRTVALPFSVVALMVVVVAVKSGPTDEETPMIAFPHKTRLSSVDQADGWLNSSPLTASDLRGKVVVVQFWTYTCINWMRTLPYVRAWSDKYEDQGLVVIGVHSPEFEFETDLNNIRRATEQMQIDYPVAIDNRHRIWRAFDNQYWPALYLIDATGRIRHHQSGEGNYAQSERMIQKLLRETGQGQVASDLVSPRARGTEAAADWGSIESGENYVGYFRTRQFASPGGMLRDSRHVYSAPDRMALNDWALVGDWTVKVQSVALVQHNGRIATRFHARDLHLVMGPTTPGASIRFRVTIDGKPPDEESGEDVNVHGVGTVREQRLYQLIRQREPITDKTFEIEFLDAGVEAFAFTFG